MLSLAATLSVAMGAGAATAYVTDQLVLNVYAEQNSQGQRLATLHSGASVETLATAGDYTQVRLNDGQTGWVKNSYLTTQVPATVRVKQLEEELDQSRATTPELAQAASRSELERLQHDLAEKQAELEASKAERGGRTAQGPPASRSIGVGAAAIAMLLFAVLGFWLGYVTLALRVRRKFGGLKVY